MYGLVLQGGGAKGSYHIGVWKALEELDIKIGAVTGTSVGALNGAFFVQGTLKEALKVWENIDPSQVFYAHEDVYENFVDFHFDYKNIEGYHRAFIKIIKDGGLDATPLRHLIENHLDEKAIRSRGIGFGLVTVCLTDLKPMELFLEDIPVGKLTDYLLASSFLPVFKPQRLDGKRFLDGALYDNLPINMMLKKGYKKIIAVENDGPGFKRSIKESDVDIRRIIPSDHLGGMLHFDARKAKKNIKMGYLDTLKSFGVLQGKRYYFKNVPSEKEAFLRFSQIERTDILKTASIMEIDLGEPQRILFEKMIPAMSRQLGIDEKSGYQEILMAISEKAGELFRVKRLESYEYIRFERAVFQALQSVQEKTYNQDILIKSRKSFLGEEMPNRKILASWAEMLLKSGKNKIEMD